MTVAQIYRLLYEEGKVPFSYQAFRLYANRFILNPGQTRRQAKGDKTADKAKGFVWNPNPNNDDLV